MPTFDPGVVFSWVRFHGWWGRLFGGSTIVITQEHNREPLFEAIVLFHRLWWRGDWLVTEAWNGRAVRITSCKLELDSVTISVELESLG